MEKFKINPKVGDVEFRVSVPAQELTRLGWNLDAPNYEGDINLLFISGRDDREEGDEREDRICCFWSFDIDGSDCQDSGDIEMAIEDLLTLLNEGIIKYNRDKDYSQDNDGYEPWLIQE
jgi:hypothetical protein